MRCIYILPAVILSAILISCNDTNLITEKSQRDKVIEDFNARKELYGNKRPDLFSLPDETDNTAKKEALQFMLAYMPLSDIAYDSPRLLEKNVDLALRSRVETVWGKEIPYDLFLHFVLPQRVNNENPDTFRLAFYDDLRSRIDGLSAYQAALEINHWCHEKVSYQPSDIRTSSPLATILSARGRCGEESTLAVAALRTAGLPARQVYTPRWAHSDDNHAWVEVWIDGKWYYLGACEPEPVLDRGWFTEPAKRAMLVHTRTFGYYCGNEQTVRNEKYYSEINALDKYAVTRDLIVTTLDESGNAVKDAVVDFLLYNYAELYPLASIQSNENGKCKFRTGKGSIIVWASKDSKYGFRHVSANDNDSIIIWITDDHPEEFLALDLYAPMAGTPSPLPSEDIVKENARRIKDEDSLRQSYIDSWMKDVTPDITASFPDIDPLTLDDVLQRSMGNYRSIISFLESTHTNLDLPLRLLLSISDKDLRDTGPEVLLDHFKNAPVNDKGYGIKFYDNYVLSPRVDNEILSPFRSSLLKALPVDLARQFSDDPRSIIAWADTSIVINDLENYYKTPLTPAGVERLRVSDAHSRDIFTVALCRTFGHASRLEPGTGRPQYFTNEWIDIWFHDSEKPSALKGYISFVSAETDPLPEYHIHFSLAVFEKGQYIPLDFGYNVRINDLPENIPLDPGKYMLVTGNRDEKGNVLASLSFFELNQGENKKIVVALRHSEGVVQTGNILDLDRKMVSVEGKEFSLAEISEKGVVISWIEPDKEPTKHIIRDLPLLKDKFDEWGGLFLFLVNPENATDAFRPGQITGLPVNSIFAWDNDNVILRSVLPAEDKGASLPVVICVDANGNIGFTSSGYRIGIGEQILKNIKKQ